MSDPALLHRQLRREGRATLTVSAALVAAAVVSASGLTPGRLGLACPVAALTGLDCPGCGATRALADLARGDLLAAAGHNALLVVVAALLTARALVRLHALARSRVPPTLLPSVPVTLALLAVWTVGRNSGLPLLGWFAAT